MNDSLCFKCQSCPLYPTCTLPYVSMNNLKGDTGEIGPKGDKGEPGCPGAQGLQGEQGVQGLKGDTGATGARGPIGPQGPVGNEYIVAQTQAAKDATDAANAAADRVDTAIASIENGTLTASNAAKLGNQLPAYYAPQASTYTKTEVDNSISAVVTSLDWKKSVANFATIATTYPTPEDGWTVSVDDTNLTYQYNGTSWVPISANSIPKSTTSVDGLMAKEQVAQLNTALQTAQLGSASGPSSLDANQINKQLPTYEVDLIEAPSVTTPVMTDDFTLKVINKGKTSQTVTVQGKNLFDAKRTPSSNNHVSLSNVVVGGFTVSDTASGTYGSVKFLMSLTPNTVYHLSYLSTSTSVDGGCVSAVNGTETTYINGDGKNGNFSFTTPSDGKVILDFFDTQATAGIYTATFSNIMLSLDGSAYTPFVPNSPSPDYPAPITGTTKVTVNGTDYSLPQELFGGSFNLITGQGVATKKEIILTGTEPNWTVYGSGTGKAINCTAFSLVNACPNCLGTSSSQVANVLCSNFLSKSGGYLWSNDDSGLWLNISFTLIIKVPKVSLSGWLDTWTDAQKIAAFKTWLSTNPVTVVYELAVPQTITGISQTLDTSVANTISSDTGTILLRKCRYPYTAATETNDGVMTKEQVQQLKVTLPSANYTADDILTKLKTVDTNNSGLNANTLQGKQASDFATSAQGTLATNAVHNTFSLNTHTLSGTSLSLTAADVGASKVTYDRLMLNWNYFTAVGTNLVINLEFPTGKSIADYDVFVIEIGPQTQNTNVSLFKYIGKTHWYHYVSAGHYASGGIILSSTQITLSCDELSGLTVGNIPVAEVFGLRTGV